MPRNEINVYLATIITALTSSHSQDSFNGCPESSLYTVLDCDMEKWSVIRSILVASNLVEIRNNWVEPTAACYAMAKKIEESLAKKGG